MREIKDLCVIIDGAGGDSGLEGRQLDSFELEVEACVQKCAKTAVGRAVFRKIRAHGRVLLIPYMRQMGIDFKSGALNAVALPLSYTPKYVKGTVVEYDVFNFARTSVVCFSPRRFSLLPPAKASQLGAGFAAADILFHELVHSGRELGGDARGDQPLSGRLARYENEAEYFAVLITNIHMSEQGRPAPTGAGPNGAYPNIPRTNIRADHGYGELPELLTDSDNFLYMPENFRLVMKYWSQHPTIAPMIAASTARFNPVGTFQKWIKNGNAAMFQDQFWFPPSLKKRLEDFAVANAPKQPPRRANAR